MSAAAGGGDCWPQSQPEEPRRAAPEPEPVPEPEQPAGQSVCAAAGCLSTRAGGAVAARGEADRDGCWWRSVRPHRREIAKVAEVGLSWTVDSGQWSVDSGQ